MEDPRATGSRLYAAPGYRAELQLAVLVPEAGANRDSCIGVDGAFVELDVLDFPFFVDNECGAPRPLIVITTHRIFLQNAVGGENLAVHVAEQGEGNADLLGERGVGRGTIGADSENNRATRFKLG